MSSNTGRKRVSAKGFAHIDKKRNRIKILLIDALLRETLLDLVMVNNKIKLFLFNQDQGVLIFGNLKTLKLNKYIRDFNVDLVDLINLVSGKSLVFKKVNKVTKKEKGDLRLFYLRQKNKAEILTVDKLTNKIKQLVFYKNKKKLFRILYKKYTD